MILVTGARGMLGGYVERVFGHEPLLMTGRDDFDVCNYTQCHQIFEKHRPRMVLHLAAATDVDRCEREPDYAYLQNVVGSQIVARLCAQFNADMVHVSTTGIFDGTKADLYTEFDEPNPLNVYAKTKYEAEKIVRHLCPHSYIVRAGWVFGGGPERDKKFVGKIVNLCFEKDELTVVNDKQGSPTYAEDFMRNLKTLVSSGFYGTYHMTGIGSSSRHDIACEIVKILGLNTRIVPISSAQFTLPAIRPRTDAARNYHLELLGLNRMRPWQTALRDYLQGWPVPVKRGVI